MSVKLRRRKLANGTISLYLDIYHSGKRQYEFLKLYLDPKDRKQNKETLQLAENIRAKRQLEIQSFAHGAVPQFKRQANFIAYFAQLAEKKNKNWAQALKYLNAYAGGQVTFASAQAGQRLTDGALYLSRGDVAIYVEPVWRTPANKPS